MTVQTLNEIFRKEDDSTLPVASISGIAMEPRTTPIRHYAKNPTCTETCPDEMADVNEAPSTSGLHLATPSTLPHPEVSKNRIDADNKLWVPIQNINQYITCGICHGYLYEASTITECMHSFCKSCIVKHVERSLQCPTCGILIHPTDPFVHIRLDRLLQDIVYGLLPRLAEVELSREKRFYEEYEAQKYSGQKPSQSSSQTHSSRPTRTVFPVVSLVLKCRCSSPMEKNLQKKFVRVTGKATILSVAAFLRKKLLIDDNHQVDIYCFCDSGCVSLDSHKTLHDVKEQYCKNQEFLQLEYDVSQRERLN